MSKRRVYFNEFNVLMDNAVYLPLVFGLLQAYAQTFPDLRENYEFMPFLFMRDELDNILKHYDNPSVAAFSVSMWNANLSMEVAKRVKQRWPDCLTVFGGPHIAYDPKEFFAQHPFVDVTVRGDGEQTFAGVLTRFLQSRDFGGVPGISFRGAKGECIKSLAEHAPAKELDVYPSPYVSGVFDEIMGQHKDLEFQAIVETNRGCPFNCAFCFWGQGGLNTRFRFFSEEYVKQTADWLGRNKIGYVFCADSNFGMFKRDPDLARFFAEAKKKYGYPEKFRVCYGKNAQESIYETAKILSDANLAKTITLARQSNDPQTLKNIQRSNIKMEVYNNLQQRYHDQEMPTYTELILGLPGESYQTFIDGLEEILKSLLDNQVFIYHCQVLPNTKLGSKEYKEQFGIVTKAVPLNEVHAAVRPRELTTEYEDIIVATSSMSVEDWRKATILSWVTQLFHGLKASFFINNYLVDRFAIKHIDFLLYLSEMHMPAHLNFIREEIQIFQNAVESLLQGNSRCQVAPDFSNIYWEPEEAAFFNIVKNKQEFYAQMYELVCHFLNSQGIAFDAEEVKTVVDYQEARVPDYKPVTQTQFEFNYNVVEYFDKYFKKERCALERKPQSMVLVDRKDYQGDKRAFAKEIMLFGRKNNRTISRVQKIQDNPQGDYLVSTASR